MTITNDHKGLLCYRSTRGRGGESSFCQEFRRVNEGVGAYPASILPDQSCDFCSDPDWLWPCLARAFFRFERKRSVFIPHADTLTDASSECCSSSEWPDTRQRE